MDLVTAQVAGELKARIAAIDVAPNLRPQEIQATMRARFGAFRTCYEGLLARFERRRGV